jgi:hypothetical protein
MSAYRASLQAGLARPTRYRQGEGVNVWGAKLNRLIDQLDSLEVSLPVHVRLCELLEEFGQHFHDLEEIASRR